MKKIKRPVAVDLFAGCGGLSLGLEAAGFDVALAIELDPVHSAVHKFNFPYGETICADITSVDSERIWQSLHKQGISEVDIVAGGPPCQGFSHIGKRQLDDPRNRLVFEFVRVVRDVKPKYFLFENVPGIFSGEHKKFVEELALEFKQIGYEVLLPPRILNAADYGVAQSRSRFILLGWQKGQRPLNYPNPTQQRLITPQKALLGDDLPSWLGAADVIGDLEKLPVFVESDGGIAVSKLRYTGARRSFDVKPTGVFELCHHRRVDRVWGHLGSVHTQASIEKFAVAQPGAAEPTSRLFKLDPSKPCHTLRAGTDSKRGAYTAPRPIHYSQARCISVREAARLHSYPDFFQFHRTIWHGCREIGNSVAPIFGRSLGRMVTTALGIKTESLPQYDLEAGNSDFLEMTMTEACNYFDVPRSVIGSRDRKKAVSTKTKSKNATVSKYSNAA